MESRKHIAIIGAGPSGLMAAERLAARGHAVTVYDRMPSAGRKLLMAGRGGLNLTHSEPPDSFLTRYGEASAWLEPCIRAFPPQALRDWCEGLGVETFIGSSRRIFPRCMKAAPLLRAWLKRLEGLGVRLAAQHEWQGMEGSALLFRTAGGQTVRVHADATLLALGGASWPRLGSNGGWVSIIQAWGVPLSPLRAANSGFSVAWSEHMRTRFAGQPLKPVALTHQGITRQGEAIITHSGIEGGVVYALSRELRTSIEADGSAQVLIDLRPGMDAAALAQKLAPQGGKSLSGTLRNARFSPPAISLLHETTTSTPLAQLSPAALAQRLKALPLTLTGSAGLERAISTAGGIQREALDAGFMLRNHPGVFVAGEMLDWEAPTGGYLLQACFSTAVAAAAAMARFVE
jgi:uncharacterized flavoprotein (TIGR03862 family)